MLNLDRYKDTFIKLISVSTGTEIFGKLIDYDMESQFIELDKPLASVNRMIADPADTLNSIIKYTYDPKIGSTTTLTLSTLYKNKGEHNVAFLNLKDFIFVPLYDSSINEADDSQKNKDMLDMKSKIEGYAEYFYDEMSNIIKELDETLENNKNEEE